jgi:inosine-uridine nucleoside N-ribohydrolase
MGTPIILDCDPGHDDAIAILLAASHPSIDLLAITTVAGNQTLDKCTLNARRVCTVAGITVPIARGAAGPLAGELRVAAEIHGESGLDGPDWPAPAVDVVEESAVELMRRGLLAHPEPVTLVPTGPLTNVATLLSTYPEVRPKIREIVLMGGSTARGNVRPYAEFNIWVDPEAADQVFASGLPVTMVGLNVSHQALVTPDVVARLRALGTPVASMCVELMTFFASAYESVEGFPAPPLHDPITIARVIDPELVTTVSANVSIETAGTFTRGATVVDLGNRTGMAPNAQVATELDVDGFFDLMVAAVGSFG